MCVLSILLLQSEELWPKHLSTLAASFSYSTRSPRHKHLPLILEEGRKMLAAEACVKQRQPAAGLNCVYVSSPVNSSLVDLAIH